MESDVYKTVAATAEGLYKEKGSRFISFIFPVKTEEEVAAQLACLRSRYHDARHHCYAYMLGADRQQWRVNDDGEPSSTAGRPILGQINSNELTDVLIVVVRYFGGTLLGVPGLIRAYRGAASEAIKAASTEERHVMHSTTVCFPYALLSDVLRLIKEYNAPIEKSEYEMECRITFSVRASRFDSLKERLLKIPDLTFPER